MSVTNGRYSDCVDLVDARVRCRPLFLQPRRDRFNFPHDSQHVQAGDASELIVGIPVCAEQIPHAEVEVRR